MSCKYNTVEIAYDRSIIFQTRKCKFFKNNESFFVGVQVEMNLRWRELDICKVEKKRKVRPDQGLNWSNHLRDAPRVQNPGGSE